LLSQQFVNFGFSVSEGFRSEKLSWWIFYIIFETFIKFLSKNFFTLPNKIRLSNKILIKKNLKKVKIIFSFQPFSHINGLLFTSHQFLIETKRAFSLSHFLLRM
jgi:hypothetical protein